MGSIIFVGLAMVFLIFLILYGVFNLMGYVFTERRHRKIKVGPTVRVVEEEEDEIVAIVAALMLFLEPGFKIKSIKKMERKYVIWRKTGWKGVEGWRGSSRWS